MSNQVSSAADGLKTYQYPLLPTLRKVRSSAYDPNLWRVESIINGRQFVTSS